MSIYRPYATRVLSSTVRRCKPSPRSIKSLEDLAELKSLDDVDPELVRRLINERTNQLNTENELAMIKQMQSAEKQHQQTSLSKFVRPAWIFLLMSSFFYLTGHYIWWRLEYDEREIELQKEVEQLSQELDAAIASNNASSTQPAAQEPKKSKKWFLSWLW